MIRLDWIRGDSLDLDIPAHAAALRAGGADFLTRAFRAAGALAGDNRVVQITRIEECPGGSTGRKLLLSVAYEKPSADLHTELFVKFSRDFDDKIRDRARDQLEPEVRLALLSRRPGFPITVPACYFADYHAASGTGILISQRIAFGSNGLEPLYGKCLDYELPQPLQHYRAIIKALGRLAGTQKSGRLCDDIARHFPFAIEKQSLSQPIRYDLAQLQRRIARLSEFAARYPQLLPENIRSPRFLLQLEQDVPRFLAHEHAIKQYLHGSVEFIALIHWNANIDNAWFWRNAHGELECGLMDWGGVSQMNVALALWGALSAAELPLWDRHLDELLGLFIDEYVNAGGPALDLDALKYQLFLCVAMMGLGWLMDAPALILAEFPELGETASRFDAPFKANETARTQLHMLTTFLNLWQTRDFGAVLDRLLTTARQ